MSWAVRKITLEQREYDRSSLASRNSTFSTVSKDNGMRTDSAQSGSHITGSKIQQQPVTSSSNPLVSLYTSAGLGAFRTLNEAQETVERLQRKMSLKKVLKKDADNPNVVKYDKNDFTPRENYMLQLLTNSTTQGDVEIVTPVRNNQTSLPSSSTTQAPDGLPVIVTPPMDERFPTYSNMGISPARYVKSILKKTKTQAWETHGPAGWTEGMQYSKMLKQAKGKVYRKGSQSRPGPVKSILKEKSAKEIGLRGFEISEFVPEATFFYRDEKGTLNPHLRHSKDFEKSMIQVKHLRRL